MTTEPKRPYHLGVAIGVTTGAYAISLMVASTLQIQHDRASIADRQPVEDAIAMLGSTHDDMQAGLEQARARYSDRADGYTALIARLDAMRAGLATMDRTVTGIERDSGSIVASVPGMSAGSGRSTQGTPGRSSGGSSSGGGSGAPRSVPAAPPPAAKPPTSGSTGASGVP